VGAHKASSRLGNISLRNTYHYYRQRCTHSKQVSEQSRIQDEVTCGWIRVLDRDGLSNAMIMFCTATRMEDEEPSAELRTAGLAGQI
jgi:hypothetical protein